MKPLGFELEPWMRTWHCPLNFDIDPCSRTPLSVTLRNRAIIMHGVSRSPSESLRPFDCVAHSVHEEPSDLCLLLRGERGWLLQTSVAGCQQAMYLTDEANSIRRAPGWCPAIARGARAYTHADSPVERLSA